MLDDNGRRPGDWTHRDLRAQAAEERREEAEREREARRQEGDVWYHRTPWIIFFIIIFWPIGLYIAWRSDWPLAGKITATVIVAAILIFIFAQSAATGYWLM